MSCEAGPWGPAPTRRSGGRRAAARRLGGEGRALRTVAGSRHPDSQVSVGEFSGEGANVFVFLGKKKTHSEFCSVLLCPLFPVCHLITQLLSLPGAWV